MRGDNTGTAAPWDRGPGRGPAFTSQPGSGSGRLRLACCTGRSSGLSGAIRTLQFLIRHAYVASVPEDGNPVEWVGRQAIVRLPDYVDLSNAGPVGEELLAVINRGAAALIVDMTATSSCDYAGADDLARAYQRVVASGTQLRLVAPAQVVRRVLSLNGLDPLVSVYPFREAAIAAGEPAANAATAAGPSHLSEELLDRIVRNLLNVGLSLEAALDLPHEADRRRIMQALRYVDETIREIRDHVFTAGRWQTPPHCEPPGSGR